MKKLHHLLRNCLFILLIPVFVEARELTLREAIEIALRESPLIRSAQGQVKAQEHELRAIGGAYYPRLKVEEFFTSTNIPAQSFFLKLNQERITSEDFDPQRLNSPKPIGNFETRITLEIPIWLGGKLQSAKKIAEYELNALSFESSRKREEVIRNVYLAYMEAVLARSAIEVSRQILEEAKERLRVTEELYRAGVVLLSDVHRAKVYLSKAKEELDKVLRLYDLSKRGIEVAIGSTLGAFEVQLIDLCPAVNFEGLKDRIVSRADLRAIDQRVKSLKEAYRHTLSENMPHISAYAQYSLNSKTSPFGGSGGGYIFGLNLSWNFDLGLSTLRKAQANLERMSSLQEYLKHAKEQAKLELERAYSEYLNALEMLRSAEERIKASREVLRVMELRYKTGLARMVDLLDAQSELDRARLERVQAIFLCHRAYIQLLFSAGLTEEVLK